MKQTITWADPMDKHRFPIGEVFEVESAKGRELVRFIEHRMGCSIVQPASYRYKRGKVQRRHEKQSREWKRDMAAQGLLDGIVRDAWTVIRDMYKAVMYR